MLRGSAMPDRKKTAASLADTLAAFNRIDQRGRLVAGLVDHGWLPRLARYRVVRPDDLLVLDLALDGLLVKNGRLRRAEKGKPGLLIVEHQTQSIGEEAFLQTDGQGNFANDEGLLPDPPRDKQAMDKAKKVGKDALKLPARARAAGKSRLVFEMPADIDSIKFTLEAVLQACRRWPLHLAAAAQPAPPPESAPGGLHWGGFHFETTQLSELLKESVVSVLGAALTAQLTRVAKELGQRIGGDLAGGKSVTRAQYRREVQARVDGALSDARALPQTQQALVRAYVEAISAGQAVGRFNEGIDLTRPIGELWPYLMLPREPAGNQTAIELPYRLHGSPLQTAGFTHADAPVTRRGRTELWHTRLGTRREDGSVDDRASEPLRYLWSPDYDDPQPLQPTMSLDPLDRQMIVKLTAGYSEWAQAPRRKRFTPRPVDVRQLMLTALGGAVKLDKAWKERPQKVDVSAWVHRAALARDYYVRVEYAGYLFPFGHAATLVKVTERKFEKEAPYGFVAPLRQRFFIVVRDRIRHFDGQAPQPHGGRELPFVAIECLTQVTPNLDTPGNQPRDRVPEVYASDLERRMAFWPAHSSADKANFKFAFVGIDSTGRRVPFNTPAIFISELKNTATFVTKIGQHYNDDTNAGRRRPGTGGATIRYAPPGGENESDVDIPTQSILFKAQTPAGSYAFNQPRYFPALEQAGIVVPAIQRLTGSAGTVNAQFSTHYLGNAFSDNPGQVFLEIVGAGKLAFGGGSGTDKAGGIASPDLTPSALSRRFGVASGNAEQFRGGTFDPTAFFPDAKLLGFLSLKDLLSAVPLAGVAAGAPVFSTRELPDRVETRFRLQQALKPVGDLFITGAGGDTQFTLSAITTAFVDLRPPQTRVDGELVHFKINLFGAIVLWFDRLRFHSEAGHKPEVDVDLDPENGVTFGGPLEFVNKLKDLIPSNGFSDPPALAVTPQGITASFSLGLPSVQVGVMALSNINLGASFNLPFTGDKPSVRFNFAERHNTFNLTVSLFGGGGFFALCVDTEGVREIEAALEFGASIQIDLGVASGGVYVKAGFYFHFATDKVEFEGYLEMGGRLRIIGLISVSLTFHLSLAYESVSQGTKPDGSPKSLSKLYGEAKLTVEVEVLFFSTSVTVKVTREFAGSESDPRFIDFIPQESVWQEYCQAFA
jgi:hypothetical protein